MEINFWTGSAVEWSGVHYKIYKFFKLIKSRAKAKK